MKHSPGAISYVYCPFAYGYSNYSRAGYSEAVLIFDDMVDIDGQGRCQTTLGGTGLAISTACKALEAARDYAMFTASPAIQRTLFFENGGQPGHRSAWLDAEVNRRSADYFRNTLPALDRAYLRPRFPGYLHFQDHAGAPIREYLMNGGDGRKLLARAEALVWRSQGVISVDVAPFIGMRGVSNIAQGSEMHPLASQGLAQPKQQTRNARIVGAILWIAHNLIVPQSGDSMSRPYTLALIE